MKTKTSMTFTAEELEIISCALNVYWCRQCEKSTTYANPDAIREGRKDLYERDCEIAGRLQVRTWDAQKRINK